MKGFNLRVLLLLSMGHLITDIYQGALPVTLPFLKDRLGLSYTMTGMILMASNVSSSVMQPLFGIYTDRRDRFFLLPMGVLCAGLGYALLTYAPDYIYVLGLVMFSGLGIASYHPEGYKTAHYFTGERSVTGMSIFSVGGNLGFSLGPFLAITIITYLGFPSLPAIIIPSILFTLVIVAMRRGLAIPEESKALTRPGAAPTTKRAYLSLAMLIAIVIMRTWTQMGIMTYIPFYYINYLKGDALFAGQLVFTFLFFGAVGTLVGAPFADRWGPRFFLRLSLFMATLTYPLIFFVKGVLLFVVLAVNGMLLIATFSVTIVMAQKLLPRRLGVTSGLMVGFAIGSGGIGVTLLGVVADNLGVPAALESIMVLPLIGFILSLALPYKELRAAA